MVKLRHVAGRHWLVVRNRLVDFHCTLGMIPVFLVMSFAVMATILLIVGLF